MSDASVPDQPSIVKSFTPSPFREWRVAVAVLLTGLSACLLALITGYWAYDATIESTEERYQQFYLEQARLLAEVADQAEGGSDGYLITVLNRTWEHMPDKPADQYLCILDADSNLLLHTMHPNTVGNNTGANLLLEHMTMVQCTLAELVNSGDEYVGDYISSAGDKQIAAFAPVQSRNWVIGIHRNKQALRTEIYSSVRFLAVAFIWICAALMPIAIFFTYFFYGLSLQKQYKYQMALTESETHLRTIFEAADNIAFITTDLAGEQTRIVSFSAGAEQIFGYTADEAVGATITILYPPATVMEYFSIQHVLEDSSKGYVKEVQLLRKSGDTFPAQFTAHPRIDAAGTVVGAVLVIVDLTAIKEAEAALRESEERYRNILESMSDWIWEVDAEGVFTYTSEKVEDILGYTPEEILGKTPFDLMPQEEGERVRRLFEEYAEHRWKVRDFENWNITKDGEKRCLLSNGTPILDEQGAFSGYRGINHDITERKHSEEQRMQLSRFPSENPNPVLRVSRDGVLVYANKSSRLLVDYWGCAKGDTLPEGWCERIERVADSAIGETYEECTGDYVFSLTLTPVPNRHYINIYGMNITERKRAEELLLEHREHLKELVDERTSELRQMLNMMAGRELRMVELKESIRQLQVQLRSVGIVPVAGDPLNIHEN